MNNDISMLLKEQGITEVFAYSRKSRDDEEGKGLKRHHDIISAFSSELGFPVRFYEEIGSSETLNRPMMIKLREDVKKKKVRALLIYRLDRLTRKVTDLERLLAEFNFHDLILIEVHRQRLIDYKDTLGTKLEGVMSDLYQEQSKMVLTAGRKKSLELFGNHLGPTLLGYDYDKLTKKLVPNTQAVIVKEIYDLYLKGYTTHSICFKLNEKGLRTSKGGLFRPKGVWTILRNKKYVGTQTYGKFEWYKDVEGKVHKKPRDESEWIVYENAHEPIIDNETFNKVKATLEVNRVVPVGARKRKYALTHVVKCGKCGLMMSPMTRKYKNHETIMLRSCYHTNYETGERCGNKGLPMENVEDYIKNKIFKEVRPLVLRVGKQMAKDRKKFSKSNGDSEINSLHQQEKQLTKQMNNLIDLQIDVGKSEQLIVRMKQVEAQLRIVNERIEQIQELGDQDDSLAWLDVFMEQSKEMIEFPINYNCMSEEDKNIFIKRYVDYVTVLDGEITGIKFKSEVEKTLGLVT